MHATLIGLSILYSMVHNRIWKKALIFYFLICRCYQGSAIGIAENKIVFHKIYIDKELLPSERSTSVMNQPVEPTKSHSTLPNASYLKIPSNILTHNTQSPTFLGQAYFSGLIGRGIGYQTGYCTLGLFLTDFQSPLQPLIDIRCHYSFQRLLASNIGIGARYNLPSTQTILGINFFYDTRNTFQYCHRTHYRQLGCGLELFTPFFEMRINGYMPIGDKLATHKTETFTYPGGYYIVWHTCQQALRGADLEIATKGQYWFLSPTVHPYIAIGPYYYHQECSSSLIGGKARVGICYDNLITCEIKASYDKVYHGLVQGLISIHFPLGNSNAPIDQVEVETVRRQEIIVENKGINFWKQNY